MTLDSGRYARCIEVLEASCSLLQKAEPESIEYDMFRNAVLKGFELTLETAWILLRKALKNYTGSPQGIDALSYKDVLRHAAKHGLMTTDEVQRWFAYHDDRKKVADDYGVGFSEDTSTMLTVFIADARRLESVLRER
jgi:hypothetical protein